MYLAETISYSNPVFDDKGVLVTFDLTQDDRTVTFEAKIDSESWSVYFSHLSEEEIKNDMVDYVIMDAYNYVLYKSDLKENEKQLLKNKEKYNSNNQDVLSDFVDNYKPSYNKLLKLLGSQERLDKAVNEEREFNNAVDSGVAFDIDDRTAYRNNDW